MKRSRDAKLSSRCWNSQNVNTTNEATAQNRESGLLLLFFALSIGLFFFVISPPAPAQSSWQLSNSKNQQTSDAEELSPEAEIQVASSESAAQSVELNENADESQAELPQTEISKADAGDTEVNESQLLESQNTEATEVVVVQDDTPLLGTETSNTTAIDSSALDQQFQQILKLKETEDAFSEKLGEAYLSYGLMLSNAGRLDEAREYFVNALHLAKINNGVYSIEQRPALRALYQIHDKRGELSEMEVAIKQIVWLEDKLDIEDDEYAYDMLLHLGNLYLDRFLARPAVNEQTFIAIHKAIELFDVAIDRYSNVPLSKAQLPYGEMALAYYAKSKILGENESSSYFDQFRGDRRSEISKLERRNKNKARRIVSSYSRASQYLRAYLEKAIAEKNQQHVVLALRDLGDLNMLFERGTQAGKYYAKAWEAAQQLEDNHSVVQSFTEPEELPAFNYAAPRAKVARESSTIAHVPLRFSVSKTGRVRAFQATDELPYPELVVKAKRTAKRLVFRPEIERGKMINTDSFDHNIAVYVRNSVAKNEKEESSL